MQIRMTFKLNESISTVHTRTLSCDRVSYSPLVFKTMNCASHRHVPYVYKKCINPLNWTGINKGKSNVIVFSNCCNHMLVVRIIFKN